MPLFCGFALQPKTRLNRVQHNGLYGVFENEEAWPSSPLPRGFHYTQLTPLDLLLGNEGATEQSLNPHPGTICWGMNLKV